LSISLFESGRIRGILSWSSFIPGLREKCFMNAFTVLGTVLASSMTATSLGATHATLLSIPNFNFAVRSSPKAISGDGSIVVGQAVTGGQQVGAYWRGQGAPTLLPSTFIATGVSEDGTAICGNFYPGGGAFRWSAASGFQTYVHPSWSSQQAYSISGDGYVIFAGGHTSYGGRGFAWVGSNLIGVGMWGCCQNQSSTVDVCDTGDWGIAVSAYNSDSNYFRCTGTGSPTDLLGFYAHAINQDGSVIVGQQFRWIEGRGKVPFTVGPSEYFEGWDVSADGTVVIGNLSAPTFNVPVIWEEGRGLTRLTDYLATQGIDLSGWVIGNAVAISSDGTAIVGNGTYQGVPQTWLVRGLSHARRCDLDRDGEITGADLAEVLLDFGLSGNELLTDIDRDGSVGGGDVSVVVLEWGS
jgi:uncharacterized membrane protein